MPYLLSALIAAAVSLGAFFGLVHTQPQAPQTLTPQMRVAMEEYLHNSELSFGTTQPFAGNTYNLAGSGVSSSASSIILVSLTIKQTGQKITTSDLTGSSGTFYITIEPGSNTKQEIVGCTGVTQNGTSATLTGCSRGLSPISPYTASTTLQFVHAGGSQVIFSDPPQLFNLYAALGNDQVFSGVNQFTISPILNDANSTSTAQAASRAYVNSVAIQGAATSTENAMGISRLAGQALIGTSQASSTSGNVGEPLVLPNKNASSSPSVVCTTNPCIPVTDGTGKISANYIATSSSYTWTASSTFSGATTTLNASTSIAASPGKGLTLNGQPYVINGGAPSASSTVLSVSGLSGGAYNLSWNSYDWQLVSSTTITSAVASTSINATSTVTGTITGPGTVGIPRWASDCKIIIDLGTTAANFALNMQFNYDLGANYSYSTSNAFSASPVANVSVADIQLLGGLQGYGSASGYFIIDVLSPNNRQKYITWRGMVNLFNSGAANVVEGFGGYNSNSTINAITIGGSANIPAGTVIRNYCSVI